MSTLTGRRIKNTYDKLLQVDNGQIVQTGLGLPVTGAINLSGSLHITGSSSVGGDLRVHGNVTAQQFIATTVSSSVVYESGSSQFGNSSDDTHIYTGSIEVFGNSAITGSQIISGTLNHKGFLYVTASGDIKFTGSLNANTNGEINHNGQVILNGSLNHSGNTVQIGNTSRTGSLYSSGALTQTGETTFRGYISTEGNFIHTNQTPQQIFKVQSNRIQITGSNIELSGSLSHEGPFDLEGDTNALGNFDLTGDSSLTGIVDIIGQLDLIGPFSTTGLSTFTGDIIQIGNIQRTGSLHNSGAIVQIGDITISGNTIKNGNLTLTGSIYNSGSNVTTGIIKSEEQIISPIVSQPHLIVKSTVIPEDHYSVMYGPITIAEGTEITVGQNSKLIIN